MNEVASQLWSLVSEDEISEEKVNVSDVFEYGANSKKLSDKPFLGLISASINCEDYAEWCEKKQDFENLKSSMFIKKCNKELNNRIENFKKGQANDLIKCFYSVNYGDFCVVIRTNDLDDIFKLAYNIRFPLEETEESCSTL